MLNIGYKIPEFLGVNEHGEELRAADFLGKRIVIYFYPKDNTPGCTAEACSLRDGMSDLTAAGYTVIGVSADSEASHIRFKEKHSLNFNLIADTDKKLIEAFGVWGEKKLAGRKYMGIIRATFIIDENGYVQRVISKVDTKNAARQILDK